MIMDRPCMLKSDKWRVHRFTTSRPRQVALKPWQLEVLAPTPIEMVSIALWGVWPPHWALEGAPMLIFPVWPMAFRAAWDRAQFAFVPAYPQDIASTAEQYQLGDFDG
jgi:hypothetical protein